MKILFFGNDEEEVALVKSQSSKLEVQHRFLKNDLDFIALIDAISKRDPSVFDVDLYIISSKDIDPILLGFFVGTLSSTAPVACAHPMFDKYPFLGYTVMVDDILGMNSSAIGVYQEVLENYERGSEDFVNAIITKLSPFRKRK